MKKLNTLTLAIILIMTACSSSNNVTNSIEKQKEQTSIQENSIMNIEDITWKLVEINSKQPSILNPEKQITLTLSHDHKTHIKKAFGFAGCNNFFGPYKLSNNDLTFSKMASTMMACFKETSETEYLKTLETVTSYEIKDNHLLLKKDNNVILKFTK